MSRAVAVDAFGRRVDYLRISVTDRCNLRCAYCMPAAGLAWTDRSEILTFEEIERFTAAAAEMGIAKIRLTGGEPLVRAGIADLVRQLSSIGGVASVAMTTNGTLLARHAGELAAAGLDRVNVSLVSLDPAEYSRVTGGGSLADVMAGIDAALAAGLQPVKINVVVARSYRQDLVAFAQLTVERPVHVRFIERMPIGDEHGCEGAVAGAVGHSGGRGSGWSAADHVSSEEILGWLATDGVAAGFGRLEPVVEGGAPRGWGPARYHRFHRGLGTIGVISPLSSHFCDRCNRLRLTADGRLRTCLFSDDELDVRHVLRHGTDDGLRSLIGAAVAAKPEWHNMRIGTARQMSQIGG